MGRRAADCSADGASQECETIIESGDRWPVRSATVGSLGVHRLNGGFQLKPADLGALGSDVKLTFSFCHQ